MEGLDDAVAIEYETSWGRRIRFTSLDEIERLCAALNFGVIDMKLVIAACDAHGEAEIVELKRALETAIVVCYCRAFTRSTLSRRVRTFAPAKQSPERRQHDVLMNLRDKVYAHTDEESGRAIVAHTIEDRGDVSRVGIRESSHPLDRIPEIRQLALDRTQLLGLEATRLAGALKRIRETGSPDGWRRDSDADG